MASQAVVHSVHIYDEHSSLIGRLCGIVKSGLEIGSSALVVATPSHRDLLVRELRQAGVDVRARAREGRFTMYDAKETLATFMVEGTPDGELFMITMGKILDETTKCAAGEQGLTVFGEMVAVLWEEGKKDAALALEELWNDALTERVFHLHCAYPRWNFINDGDEAGLAAVCHAHSHVLA